MLSFGKRPLYPICTSVCVDFLTVLLCNITIFLNNACTVMFVLYIRILFIKTMEISSGQDNVLWKWNNLYRIFRKSDKSPTYLCNFGVHIWSIEINCVQVRKYLWCEQDNFISLKQWNMTVRRLICRIIIRCDSRSSIPQWRESSMEITCHCVGMLSYSWWARRVLCD